MTRLAQVLGVLCLATDLGTGRQLDHGLRTCLLAMNIGHDLGLADAELVDLYYLAMLRMLGCTVDASRGAEMMGDEVAVGGAMDTLDLERQKGPVEIARRGLRGAVSSPGTAKPLPARRATARVARWAAAAV